MQYVYEIIRILIMEDYKVSDAYYDETLYKCLYFFVDSNSQVTKDIKKCFK